MGRPGPSAALYLVLTFFGGVAVGASGMWLYTSTIKPHPRGGPEQARARYMQEMETRLKLTPEQREKLTTILDASRQLYRELFDKHRPEFDALQQHQREQVRAILTPEQVKEYEKMLLERDRHRKGRGF